MSAIFGIFHRDGKTVSQQDMDVMNRALLTYGPDTHGLWLHDHIALGSRQMRFTLEDIWEVQRLHSNTPDSALVLNAYEK